MQYRDSVSNTAFVIGLIGGVVWAVAAFSGIDDGWRDAGLVVGLTFLWYSNGRVAGRRAEANRPKGGTNV